MKFHFTVIKKNQILASAITLMLITAGYLNYKYEPNNVYEVTKIDEHLGDAFLVDAQQTIPVFQNYTNINDNSGNMGKNEIDNYFINTRIERLNNYAEEIENYEKILLDINSSEDSKKDAQNEIKRINNIRNSIFISENMIKLKGFEDSVVLVNDESINVVVKAKELKSVDITKIQSIIENEFKMDLKNIHITNKE